MCCLQLVVPSQGDLIKQDLPYVVKQFLGDLSRNMKSFGKEIGTLPLPKCGISCMTCWRLLVECCRHAPPSQLTLANPPRLKVLATVLRSFPSFWSMPQPETSVEFIQRNSEACFTDYMQEYESWYLDVCRWLFGVQQQILNSEMALCNLNDFKQNYNRLKELYDSFLCSSLFIDIENINTIIEAFERKSESLTSFLLYQTSDHKWYI